MKKRIFVFLLICLVFTSCTSNQKAPRCSAANVDKAGNELTVLLNKWNDLLDLAGTTPRAYLINPIIEMEHLKWETEALVVPSCLDTAQTYFTNSMEDSITAMTLFLGDEPDQDVSSKMDDASTNLSKFNQELFRVRQCAPRCGD